MRHQHTQTRAVADDALMRAEAAAGEELSSGEVIAVGTTTLAAGLGAAVLVPGIKAGSVVLFALRAVNGSTTLGIPMASITAGTSFSTTSETIATPGTTQAGDASTYGYIVVNPPA